MEHILTLALSMCHTADEAHQLLSSISTVSRSWRSCTSTFRKYSTLTVRDRQDLRTYAKLSSVRPQAWHMLKIVNLELDLGTNTFEQLHPSNLRSFFPRAPNVVHFCIRYKPLSEDRHTLAATMGGDVAGRNVCARSNFANFWSPLEQVRVLVARRTRHLKTS